MANYTPKESWLIRTGDLKRIAAAIQAGEIDANKVPIRMMDYLRQQGLLKGGSVIPPSSAAKARTPTRDEQVDAIYRKYGRGPEGASRVKQLIPDDDPYWGQGNVTEVNGTDAASADMLQLLSTLKPRRSPAF